MLKAFVDQDVLIQFKHAVYVVAAIGNRLIPMSMQGNTPNEPGPPVGLDRIEGHLREQDGSFILAYANPALQNAPNAPPQVNMGIDPENVHAIWGVSKIQIVGGGLITP
jgi:hypothetical protein